MAVSAYLSALGRVLRVSAKSTLFFAALWLPHYLVSAALPVLSWVLLPTSMFSFVAAYLLAMGVRRAVLVTMSVLAVLEVSALVLGPWLVVALSYALVPLWVAHGALFGRGLCRVFSLFLFWLGFQLAGVFLAAVGDAWRSVAHVPANPVVANPADLPLYVVAYAVTHAVHRLYVGCVEARYGGSESRASL